MALTLRQHYPVLSVGLLEASRYDTPRLGEILSPAAASILGQLKVTDAFERERFRPVYGSAVSWRGPLLADSPHLFTFHGPGWHLDRARLDAMLAREAARRGTELQLNNRATVIKNDSGGWRLHLASGDIAQCRFLIDATGRGASIARRLGARLISSDRLTGFVCTFSLPGGQDPRTLIESVEHGWWYTGALDGDMRIAALMTDADVGRDLDLADVKSWQEYLRQTHYVAKAVGHALPLSGPMIRSANSQYLEPVVAENWMAVGDAAMALDPLSGQGIVAALRSGVFAAYAIGDYLTRDDPSGLQRYQCFVHFGLTSVQRARARYYAEERRWPHHPFWSRRVSAS